MPVRESRPERFGIQLSRHRRLPARSVLGPLEHSWIRHLAPGPQPLGPEPKPQSVQRLHLPPYTSVARDQQDAAPPL